MKSRKPHPTRQGGFTLIELSIVIAIGMLLILAGLKFGPTLMQGTQVSNETQNVGMLATNLRNLYRGRYANLTNAQAIRFNLVPNDMLDGANISGNWGNVTLTPSNLVGGNPNTALQISLANIPQAVCTKLAPALLGAADELTIQAAMVKSAANPNPTNDVVSGACGQGGGAAVTIAIRAI